MGSLAHGNLWFLTPDGYAQGHDFSAFRAAGVLALSGDAAAAYEQPRFDDALAALHGARRNYRLGWLNPPVLLLVLAPLAALPYASAWGAWLALTGSVFAAGMRAALPAPGSVVLGFAAPASFICVIKGQSGLLSAGLLALGLARLDRQPRVGGVCIGLLCYKPHLGLVLPFLLLAGRRWEALAAASATVSLLAVASAAAFGTDAWLAFFASVPATADRFLGDGAGITPALQSFYGVGAVVGRTVDAALAAHVPVALVAAGAAVWVWGREATPEARAAAAIAASFLAAPYVLNHDAVVLTAAAAFLARAGLREGFLPGERALLILACLAPGAMLVWPPNLMVPSAALLLLLLAVLRARCDAPPAATVASAVASAPARA